MESVMNSERALYKKLVERIINNDGSLSISLMEWRQNFPRTRIKYNRDPKCFVDRFPILRFENHGAYITFELEIRFGFCKDYTKSDGCKDLACSNLHCCVFYLQGKCKFNQICKYSHELKNSHNFKILQKYCMDFMDNEEILRILKREKILATKPLVCPQYNSFSGCKFGSDCINLHLCNFYVNNECNYGICCKRCHDLMDPHVQNVLVKQGINVKQKHSAILNDIKKILGCSQNVKRNKSCDGNNISMQISSSSKKDQIRQKTDKSTDESPLICMFYLRGKCLFHESCQKFHQLDHLPYHWQYKDFDEWIDLPQNKDIESSYCDCKDNIQISVGGSLLTLDFINLMWRVEDQVRGKIRRLSTNMQNDANKDFQYLSLWNWYWLKNKEWSIYKAENGYPSSDKIEYAYQNDPKTLFKYKTEGYTYILDFEDMIQTNIKTGKSRGIRRRPDYFDEKAKKPKSVAILNKTEVKNSIHIDFPDYWSKTDDDLCHLVEVSQTANEFLKMNKIFTQTTNKSIKKLQRIQNSELWRFYVIKRDSLKKKGEIYSAEKYLFHGTKKAHIDAICQQGFDFRLSGTTSGTTYGRGSYFARDASYSTNYSDCNKVFVAKVIVGESVKGSSSYTRPPLRDPAKHDTYESCINSRSNPSIYIIFDNNQAYPEYLIEY